MFSLKLWQIAYMDVYINLKVSCEKSASRKVLRRYEKIWDYLFPEYLLACPSLYRHLSQSTSKLVDIGLISEGEERIYERWGHMLDIN